ncbi:MAG: SurA N-terminal domain-containing protein [Anaerolineales bacterium]|nr:SurA N-terminal domain-containing protein [Anaerolineales bacterium]
MAKEKSVQRPTKKHLARAQREALLRKRLIVVSAVVGVILIVLTGYSLIEKAIIFPNTVIMTVDGEEFYAPEFQARMEQYYTLVGVSDPVSTGASVLEEMVEISLIRAEAARLGIVVTDEELDAEIAALFGYVIGEQPEATPVAEGGEDAPTPTPYSREAYEAEKEAWIAQMGAVYGVTEEDLREDFEIGLLQERISEALSAEIERVQDHVQLQHILVADEETALAAKARLDAGEAWDDIVGEYSIDALTSDASGELGWLSLTDLVTRYGQIAIAVYGYPEGEVTAPVQATDGWHLFRSLGHEERELSDLAFQSLVSQNFQARLDTLKSEADIVIAEDWQEYIPTPPVQLR